MKNKRIFGLFLALLLTLLGEPFFGLSLRAVAQVDVTLWTQPVNLSQSGAASNPTMVVDGNGSAHVIWMDTFLGYLSTMGDGAEWALPADVTIPIRDLEPILVPDKNGFVHAFWLVGPTVKEEQDKPFVLYYSRAAVVDDNHLQWMAPQRLSVSALDLDVAVDEEGQLHLAYLRPHEEVNFPAGVYYQRLLPAGQKWSNPTMLYQSAYLRSLALETSNVEISTSQTAAGQQVFVVWDNRPRGRIYFAKSGDGGETWLEPTEVDRPEEGVSDGGPSNLLINTQGDHVLLVWQFEHGEASCTHYYQESADAGQTWQTRQQILESSLSCPDQQFLESNGRLTLLITTFENQVFLQAWDGAKWSDPQSQDVLNNFVDPETNRPLRLACYQFDLVADDLYVVGCDSGGGDIWWTKRQLIDTEQWFPREAVWKPLVSLATSDFPAFSPVIVDEDGERMHLFWSQANEARENSPGATVYYARSEGGRWTQPLPVLSSPLGKAEQPDAAITPDGRVVVVWSGGEAGEIYTSQAQVGQAIIAASWTKPQLLPAPEPAGSSPDILVDPQGVIYVAYAIPLNEERGIYLTSSHDGGETWSQPVQVFDAVAVGWSMVDQPHLALTGNGDLHAIYTRSSLPNGPGPLGLFYSRSSDGGQTWSVSEMVVEKPVVWSQVIGAQDQTVHRIWQELASGRMTLWHEYTNDNGQTWTRIAPVSIFGDTGSTTPIVTWDQTGTLHLMQIVSRGINSFALQHWIWNGEVWSTERGLDLELATTSAVPALQAIASSSGRLGVVFSSISMTPGTNQEQFHLYFTDRTYTSQSGPAGPAAEATVTPAPVFTATPTQEPTVTPTVEAAPTQPTEVESSSPEPNPSGNTWVGTVLLPAVAGLIVLVALLVGVQMRKSR